MWNNLGPSQFYAALALSYVDSDGAQIIREEAIPLLVDLMISKHVDTQMRVVFTKLISKLYMFLVDANSICFYLMRVLMYWKILF